MQYKKLNEFNVDDVVTNDVGDIFEIKAINKTGSVKIFTKGCVDVYDEYVGLYEDVYGNDVSKVGKTYTVNIENPVWRLVSEDNSLEQEILSYESQIKELQDKISNAKNTLEKSKYPEINVGEMYVFTKPSSGIRSDDELVGIVVSILDSDSNVFVFVDTYFNIHEHVPTDFKTIVHVKTAKAKKMAEQVSMFYNEYEVF